MVEKITINYKSFQKNIGGGQGGQNPPASMSRVKNLLFALTSLLTRGHNFINGVLLCMISASNCKSIYTKYLNMYLKLVTTSAF